MGAAEARRSTSEVFSERAKSAEKKHCQRTNLKKTEPQKTLPKKTKIQHRKSSINEPRIKDNNKANINSNNESRLNNAKFKMNSRNVSDNMKVNNEPQMNNNNKVKTRLKGISSFRRPVYTSELEIETSVDGDMEVKTIHYSKTERNEEQGEQSPEVVYDVPRMLLPNNHFKPMMNVQNSLNVQHTLNAEQNEPIVYQV